MWTERKFDKNLCYSAMESKVGLRPPSRGRRLLATIGKRKQLTGRKTRTHEKKKGAAFGSVSSSCLAMFPRDALPCGASAPQSLIRSCVCILRLWDVSPCIVASTCSNGRCVPRCGEDYQRLRRISTPFVSWEMTARFNQCSQVIATSGHRLSS